MAWINLTDGFYKGVQFHTPIPSKDKQFGASSQKTDKERRLQMIRYPRVNGGKVNDFGANQDVITIEVIFFGNDYLEKYNAFLEACNNGEPGILVVPVRKKALVAYFQKVSESVEVGSGSTIKGTFTFVEDTTIDPIELQPPGATIPANVSEKASALSKKVADAKKALNNNAFVGAIRSAEGGLSAARRYSGAALALDQAVRARIVSITDNTSGTLGLIGSALAVFNKPKVVTSVSSTSKNVFDPDTGQEVVPFDQDDTITAQPDPLEPPLETTINEENTPEISSSNLNSNAGIEVFSTKVSELLKEQREELSQLAGGRADDIARSLTQVVVALDDFRSSIAKQKGSPVVVPSDLSMMEVMFHNRIGLEKLDYIIKDNFHINDPLVIPAGSVVYL